MFIDYGLEGRQVMGVASTQEKANEMIGRYAVKKSLYNQVLIEEFVLDKFQGETD